MGVWAYTVSSENIIKKRYNDIIFASVGLRLNGRVSHSMRHMALMGNVSLL